MRVVYKRQLIEINTLMTITVDKGGCGVLCAQEQKGYIQIYYEGNVYAVNNPDLAREVTVIAIPTGYEKVEDNYRYVSTVIMPTGLVWHVYEILNN